MLCTGLLCKFLVGVVWLVHVAVDMVEIKILDVILLEIIDSVRFAIGLRYFCDYQMTQDLLGNPVETDAVCGQRPANRPTMRSRVARAASHCRAAGPPLASRAAQSACQ